MIMVTYEFVLETLDYYEGCGDNPDIIDTSGYPTLFEAHEQALKSDEPWRIALRRDVGDDLEGITDRAYAYPDASGRLPEFFSYGAGEEGPRVPLRFKQMFFPIDSRKR